MSQSGIGNYVLIYYRKTGLNQVKTECFFTRRREYNRKSTIRRKKGITGEPEHKVCPNCGKNFEGLAVTYCSKECSDEGRRKIRNEVAGVYYRNNREEHIKNTIRNRKIREKRSKIEENKNIQDVN